MIDPKDRPPPLSELKPDGWRVLWVYKLRLPCIAPLIFILSNIDRLANLSFGLSSWLLKSIFESDIGFPNCVGLCDIDPLRPPVSTFRWNPSSFSCIAEVTCYWTQLENLFRSSTDSCSWFCTSSEFTSEAFFSWMSKAWILDFAISSSWAYVSMFSNDNK